MTELTGSRPLPTDVTAQTGTGDHGEGDQSIGVAMGQVFALAEQFTAMSLDRLEQLLDSPLHEARAGAVKIMAKSTSPAGFSTSSLVRATCGSAVPLSWPPSTSFDVARSGTRSGSRVPCSTTTTTSSTRPPVACSGKHDRARLLQFLEDNAAAMPRTMLRYACEHLDQKERVDQKERAHYRAVTRSAATDEARR